MKPQHRILLVIVLALHALIATGCVNTAHGVQKDYQRAEDNVEKAVK